jgi:hypothetical protein
MTQTEFSFFKYEGRTMGLHYIPTPSTER